MPNIEINTAFRIILVSLGIFFQNHNINAQENKIPSIAEFNRLMTDAVKQSNKQISGTRIDEYTIINILTYDEKVPLLSYHYTTSILRKINSTSLNKAGIEAINKYHLGKTCNSTYRSFMKVYGLIVSHTFTDDLTGKEVIKIQIGDRDCL